MRLKLSLLILAVSALSGAQVWEKPIAPGLIYHMEIDATTPRIIHALRFSPGSPTKAMVDLAGKKVYAETATKGRLTVSQMVAEQGAIAGINGDFFPYTGDPLGAMVRSGELISVPALPRASFGWSNAEGSGTFGIMSFHGSFTANGNETAIDNVDGDCPPNGIAFNTETTGFSLCKTPNVQLTIRIAEADFSPNGKTTGTIQAMTADEPSLAVPKGCAILVAQGAKTGALTSLRPGDKITIQFRADGIDWRKVDQLIGGGPFLVKDGQITPDSEAEHFRDDFSKQRHPRSAVGKTANGDFWFVAVDGRSPVSAGATIQELAQVMFKLGCRDAINLDGGGSTDMNIMGVNVNRPSDGVERELANGIFFFGPRPASPVQPAHPATIDGPATLDMAGTVTLHAMDANKAVPDAEVIWSAQGAAWIDQGGLLKPLKPGPATVTAWVHGQIVMKQITVTGSPRTKPTPSRSGGGRGKRGGG
ncbi:MAG TPA: phosphodiester glycosidase family protein [Fimbriimonadaceae bacterium]|nr:phosphodiester glycosidase family protein [Fimbriimonadaceae bacterium]